MTPVVEPSHFECNMLKVQRGFNSVNHKDLHYCKSKYTQDNLVYKTGRLVSHNGSLTIEGDKMDQTAIILLKYPELWQHLKSVSKEESGRTLTNRRAKV